MFIEVISLVVLKTDLHTLKHEIKQYKSRKVGNAQFFNFDLIFKFAIEFGNQFHLFLIDIVFWLTQG